jgi:hypothetical protein
MSSGYQQKKGNLKDKILVELQTHSSLTQNYSCIQAICSMNKIVFFNAAPLRLVLRFLTQTDIAHQE